MFERTFKPLYERLELVAKEYHRAVEHANLRLQQDEPKLESIINQLQAQRADLIITRNGIVGEALGFVKRYGGEHAYAHISIEQTRCVLEHQGEFEKLAFD